MNKRILSIVNDLDDYGRLKKCSLIVSHKNKICGDKVKIYLNIKKNKIDNIKYHLNSCLFCHASTSVLVKIIKKKNISYCQKFIKKILHSEFGKTNLKKRYKLLNILLNKKYILRKDCIYVPIYAINKINKKI